MSQTIIGVGDAKAVKKYSAFLAVDTPRKSYWGRKLMGDGEAASMPLQRLTELESDAGENISFDLSMQLTMQPVEGDAILENKEEALQFYSDSVYIDQMRGGVNSGGKMTRKRTIHKLRDVARKRQSEWWARVFDELCFMYASGARGTNTEYVYPTSYTGFAGNSFTSPDSNHIIFANGTAKRDVEATNKMTVSLIDKAVAYAQMMGGGTQVIPQIQPIKINGEEHYVWVGDGYQVYDLRQDTGATGWLAMQKAAAAAEGRKSPIFTGSLGMHNGVVLQQHKACIRFTDYGAGGAVEATRSLFLGEQAMVVAFGSPGTGLRFGWHEETRDNGNQLIISTSSILGMKKVTFNGLDYGIMAIDTAATKP